MARSASTRRIPRALWSIVIVTGLWLGLITSLAVGVTAVMWPSTVFRRDPIGDYRVQLDIGTERLEEHSRKIRLEVGWTVPSRRNEMLSFAEANSKMETDHLRTPWFWVGQVHIVGLSGGKRQLIDWVAGFGFDPFAVVFINAALLIAFVYWLRRTASGARADGGDVRRGFSVQGEKGAS